MKGITANENLGYKITTGLFLLFWIGIMCWAVNEDLKQHNKPKPTKEEQSKSISNRMEWYSIEKNGHDYLFYFLNTGGNGHGGMIHDPDCKNQKHKE